MDQILFNKTAGFVNELLSERERQFLLWGDQRHPDGTGGGFQHEMAELATEACELAVELERLAWSDILLEEVYEALAEDDPTKLREELIQAAAVAAAWIYDIDRRAAE